LAFWQTTKGRKRKSSNGKKKNVALINANGSSTKRFSIVEICREVGKSFLPSSKEKKEKVEKANFVINFS
jgi:hypothetical protein